MSKTRTIINILGVVLIIAGVVGLFQDPVFGMFEVDGAHNLVHILSGVLAIIFTNASMAAARGYAIVFGIIYLFLAIAGWTTDAISLMDMEINSADGWLHLILGILFLGVGIPRTQPMPKLAPQR